MLIEKTSRFGRSLAAGHPQTPKYGTELARSHNRLGILLRNPGRTQDAASELRERKHIGVPSRHRVSSRPEKPLKRIPKKKPVATGTTWASLTIEPGIGKALSRYSHKKAAAPGSGSTSPSLTGSSTTRTRRAGGTLFARWMARSAKAASGCAGRSRQGPRVAGP